jgi:F-type H+-transporting ATPase subunit b
VVLATISGSPGADATIHLYVGQATPAATSATTTTEEAPQPANPILPVPAEMVWGGVIFLVIWALMKFVLLKPIQATMAQRADQVRDDIDAAEQARSEAVDALADYEASLASARVEAGRIIDDARNEAEDRRRQIIAAAESAAGDQRAAAAAEIASAKADALASLRTSVSSIAVQAAQAVVQKPLDEAAQRAVVDEYLSSAGAQN